MKTFFSLEGNTDGEIFELDHFIPSAEGKYLIEHVMDRSLDRWCLEFGDIISEGDCGRGCSEYDPFNKINGRCRWATWCCDETGNRFKVVNSKLVLTD